jgi:ubiquinol-cytochrome c reductase core subunit 2
LFRDFAADILRDAYNAATIEDTARDGLYSLEYLRRNHDLKDAQKYMHESNKTINPAFDALHRVAFRTGLGKSLVSSNPDPVNLETLRNFSLQNMSGSNAILVGTGIENDKLNSLSKTFTFAESNASSKPTKSIYYGGESRIPGQQNTYLIAFPGAAIGTPRFAVLEVIKAYLGGDIRVKWGAGLTPLVPNGTVFNLGYSDTGLFGLNVHTDIETTVKKGLKSLQTLASGKLDQDVLARAKAQAAFAHAETLENSATAVQSFGNQVPASFRFLHLF